MTKLKAAVKLYRNSDPAMVMVREFEERTEELGHSSLIKEAERYAELMGLQLQLEYSNPICIEHDGEEVITAENEGRTEKGFRTEDMRSGTCTELAGKTDL